MISEPDPTPFPSTPGDQNTITFKRTHLYAVLLPLAFVLGLSLGYIFWGRNQSISPSQRPLAAADVGADPTPDPAQKYRRFSVPIDNHPILGPVDAPITLVEFSDYECPFCKKWYQETWSKLQAAYPGKIRLVYRDFPLYSIHQEAEPAAIAADCAGEQNKYWEFHNLLFGGNSPFGTDTYQNYAAQIGLDTAQFTQCVSTEKYKYQVSSDYEFASNLGVNSTPTFFMNGIPLVGAQPFEVFKQLIDKELAGELPKN
jgi:protein-disulfide isomerase